MIIYALLQVTVWSYAAGHTDTELISMHESLESAQHAGSDLMRKAYADILPDEVLNTKTWDKHGANRWALSVDNKTWIVKACWVKP